MKLDPNKCSFNSGLYVTDLDLWRKNNITNKLEYWLELNTKYVDFHHFIFFIQARSKIDQH